MLIILSFGTSTRAREAQAFRTVENENRVAVASTPPGPFRGSRRISPIFSGTMNLPHPVV